MPVSWLNSNWKVSLLFKDVTRLTATNMPEEFYGVSGELGGELK